jgi:hypothetical protein
MTLKHNLLYILTGLSILGSFGFSVWVLAFHEIPDNNRELFIHVLGMIDGAFVGALVATFFGSSKKDHEPTTTTRTTQTFEVKETPPIKKEDQPID